MIQRPSLLVEFGIALMFFWRIFWRVTLFLLAMLAVLFGAHYLFSSHPASPPSPLATASFFLTANALALLYEVVVIHGRKVWQPLRFGGQAFSVQLSRPMTWPRALLVLWAIGWRVLLIYSAILYFVGIFAPPTAAPAIWYADSTINLLSQVLAIWWVQFHPLPWARTVFLVSPDYRL